MGQINTTIILEITNCCACGVEFAAPATLLQNRREKGSDFYCPNGHTLHFTKTDVQRLREQLDRTVANCKHLAEEHAAAQRSNTSLRGVNTRLRRQLTAAKEES